jgi:two-component system, NtrC family, response regulator GlrR
VFRADLYYRINVFRLRMTPLRERRGDIAALANHFVRSVSGSAGRRTLSSAALRRLMLHDWPGNVRELLNVIQRAVAFSDGTQILSSHISLPSPILIDEANTVGFREARARAIGEFEKSYLKEILTRHSGNITRAAREAGKDRRALGRLVKKHQIARSPA